MTTIQRVSRCLAILVLLSCCPKLAAQTWNLEHHQQCNDLLKEVILAEKSEHWGEQVIAAERRFETNCKDLMTPDMEAASADAIGMALKELGRYEDAIPLFKRCLSFKPDETACWVNMGDCFGELGQLEAAMDSYKKTISIGGYDERSAMAVKHAQNMLAIVEERMKVLEKPTQPEIETGSGFFVSAAGHILTAAHVANGCKKLSSPSVGALTLVASDSTTDLALLKASGQADIRPATVATLRSGSQPQLGESVLAFGFPLQGLLSSQGNVTTGTLTALEGPHGDVHLFQISAPLQPGNSGGPLLDQSANVIGVVVAKLDTVKIATLTGDIPENVNFAVTLPAISSFLEQHDIRVSKRPSTTSLSNPDLAKRAQSFTVLITCAK